MGQKIKQDIYIGGNIRSLRMKAGLTQEQVAARLQVFGVNMSRDFYAHIESEDYNIRVSELVGLKHIFHCAYDDFFAGL